MIKKQLILLKNIPNSRLEYTNDTLFQTKMVEIDTLFQTETAKNHTLWRCTYLYSLYKGVPPPSGANNVLQVMSLAAYASETKKGQKTKEIEKNPGLNNNYSPKWRWLVLDIYRGREAAR